MTAPSLVAELAATLDPCPGCGALPAACLEALVGLAHRPCCDGCGHYPELPHPAVGVPHDPATCAAWADEQGVPRNVACEVHWLPVVVAEWRRDLSARLAAARAAAPRRSFDPAELVSPDQLYLEAHYNGKVDA